MVKSVEEEAETFLHCPGTPGKVDDQALTTEYGDTSGKHGPVGALHGSHADILGDTRRVSVCDFLRDFRSDVPGGKTGTAGGNDKIRFTTITKTDKL